MRIKLAAPNDMHSTLAGSTAIEATMAPSQGTLDLRVEDYLDDKLQSTTDLDLLSTLIAQVQSQQSLLQSQLDDARQNLAASRQTASDKQASVATKIKTFQDLQASIDKRLLVVSQS